ncbi:YqaA family protein [Vulgatibacter sp.]|uniref:YqaA family protein n=1 Tax=Vulgatibacter sp. TaxID=1971226 RepID=UPI0035673B7D
MDPVLLATWGLPGLFLAAFLSGSVVPLPSEAVLVALLGGGLAPLPLVTVATAGNLLGAATLFWIGTALSRGAGGALGRALQRRIQRDPQAFERAQARLRRFGAPLLLLTWVPIVGDLFVIAAGFVGVRLLPFVIFTGVGKAARFALVASATAAALGA